ncbi:MAG TPA: hypothetical protein VGI82_12805 [Chitinophagaceae bacterium]
MHKNFILIFLVIFFHKTSISQKIFYSDKGKDEYQLSQNYIIGKVSDNIIIVDHRLPTKKFEILVYDYNMHLKKTISLNSYFPGYLARIDFANHGDSFDAIAQYYTSQIFYCKVIRFDGQGHTIQQSVTIDSIFAKRSPGDDTTANEIYNIIQSEDKKQLVMMRAFTGIKSCCLQLDYFYLNDELKTAAKKQFLIPFNKSVQLSPFYVDNAGNLLFSEFMPEDNTHNLVTFYKIPRDTDAAFNRVQYIDNNFPSEMAITIDNNNHEYLLNGIFFKPIPGGDSLSQPKYAQGIYSSLFAGDLSVRGKDTLVWLNAIKGLDSFTNHHNFSFNNIVPANGGFYLSFNSHSITGQRFQSAPGYTGSTTGQPDFDAFRTVPAALGSPYKESVGTNTYTNPMIIQPGTGDPGADIERPWVDFPNPYDKNRKLVKVENEKSDRSGQMPVILYLNSNNEVQWLRAFDTNTDNNIVSFKKISSGIIAQNMHFVFSHTVHNDKKITGEIAISPDGKYKMKNMISSDALYDIQAEKGVQVDERSVVFPCKARFRLAFVRIEFD